MDLFNSIKLLTSINLSPMRTAGQKGLISSIPQKTKDGLMHTVHQPVRKEPANYLPFNYSAITSFADIPKAS
jgi:hypothetical protein